ncbi:MAG: ATP-dependent DNA helicase [Acidimicrobiales bacterium]
MSEAMRQIVATVVEVGPGAVHLRLRTGEPSEIKVEVRNGDGTGGLEVGFVYHMTLAETDTGEVLHAWAPADPLEDELREELVRCGADIGDATSVAAAVADNGNLKRVHSRPSVLKEAGANDSVLRLFQAKVGDTSYPDLTKMLMAHKAKQKYIAITRDWLLEMRGDNGTDLCELLRLHAYEAVGEVDLPFEVADSISLEAGMILCALPRVEAALHSAIYKCFDGTRHRSTGTSMGDDGVLVGAAVGEALSLLNAQVPKGDWVDKKTVWQALPRSEEEEAGHKGPFRFLPGGGKGRRLVTEARYWHGEAAFALGVTRQMARKIAPLKAPLKAPRQEDNKVGSAVLSSEQKRVVESVFGGGITVLCGAAGTGKTLVARAAGDALRREKQFNTVAWTGTTGRAAKLFGRDGATTLHSFLGIRPGEWMPRNLPPVDLLIVDEVSMLDTMLAGSLGRYLQSGLCRRVLLVGDPGQLPPVGPGRALWDLVEAGQPGGRLDGRVFELNEVFRHERRGILDLAQAIRGEVGSIDWELLDGVSIFEIADEAVNDAVVAEVRKIVAQYPEEIPLVLASMRRTGVGVREMNRRLMKEVYLPDADPDLTFTVGMRVIQTRSMLVGKKEERVVVTNGSLGQVVAVGGEVVVQYDDYIEPVTWPAGAMKARGDDDGLLIPAYCLTVHRSQGTGARHVVIAVPNSGGAWGKELGYTAVTRASSHLTVIGAPDRLFENDRSHGPADRISAVGSWLERGRPKR